MAGVLGEVLRRVLPVSSYAFLPTVALNPAGKAVVVIGCDTGLGREMALRFASKGYAVVAACLSEAGSESLRVAFPGGQDAGEIVALPVMDVTDSARVAQVAREATRELSGRNLSLHSVVHVAGVMLGGPIAWTDTQVFRKEIEVNYLGLVNVIKAFIEPLLAARVGRPRLVVVTSEIGLMPGFHGLGGYCASKHAAEAVVNSFRMEMAPLGITAHTICPGITDTPFLHRFEHQVDDAWQTASPAVREAYGEEFYKWWREFFGWAGRTLAQPPDDALACIEHAVTACWPKQRYHTGLESRLAGRFIVHSPDFFWDFGWRVAQKVMGEPVFPPHSRL